MPVLHRLLATSLAAAALHGASAATPAADASAPYTVEVWSSVDFGPDGQAQSHRIVDAERYPAAFAEQVRQRLARARIPPPQDDGRPATLRSGVRLMFVVTPAADGGGQVRVAGVTVGPLPVTRYFASYPRDVAASGGWEGEVQGHCRVGTDGRCAAIEVATLPGMPESVRRFARASLEGWRFEPQQLNGRPIEGEYVLRMRLNTLDSAPEDFREDKFERLTRMR